MRDRSYDLGGLVRCNVCNLLVYREDISLDADEGNMCVHCIDERGEECDI